MLRFITRHKTLVIYLAAYFFAISITLRYLFSYQNDASLIKVVSILAAFLVLLVIQTLLRDRSQLYTHIILALQTGILVILSLLPPRLDFFSTLSVTLALQAVYVFSGKTAFRWIGVFAVVVAVRVGQGLRSSWVYLIDMEAPRQGSLRLLHQIGSRSQGPTQAAPGPPHDPAKARSLVANS